MTARFSGSSVHSDPENEARHKVANQQLKDRLEKEHADFLKPEWEPNKNWWKAWSRVTKH